MISREASNQLILKLIRSLSIALILGVSAGCGGGIDAEGHVERALAQLEKGDDQAAIIELKAALLKAEEHPKARLLLGEAYLRIGAGTWAEKELSRARSLGQGGAAVEAAILRSILVRGGFKEVLRKLEGPPPLESESVAWSLRGRAHLGLNDLEAAATAFQKAIAFDELNPEAQIGLAQLAFVRNNLGVALKRINEVIATTPEEFDAWLVKGDIAISQSNFEEAEVAFNKAVMLRRAHPMARIKLTGALIRVGKLDVAEDAIKRISSLIPGSLRVFYLRAEVAFERGNFEVAQTHLREVLKINPNHPASMRFMAMLYYRTGEFWQAQEMLTLFLADQPNHVEARRLLGRVELQLGRPQEAATVLRPALNAYPKDPGLMALMASSYMHQGEFKVAERYLERAVDILPDSPFLRTQLAATRSVSGAPDRKVVEELKTAAKLDPEFSQADVLLVMMYLRGDEHELALEAAQNFAHKQPQDVRALVLMGSSFEAQGDIEHAREQYAKAQQLKPGSGKVAAKMARLDLLDSNVDAARKRFEAVLTQDENNLQALISLARLATNMPVRIALLERARKAHPDVAQVYVMLVDIYLRQGAEGSARATVTAFGKQNQNLNELPALLGLSRVQIAVGESLMGLKSAERLVRLYPDSASAHYQLGQARNVVGDLAGAQQSMQAVVGREPSHLAAKLGLGNLAFAMGQFDEALRVADRIEKEHPESDDVHILKVKTYLAKGKSKEAVAAAKRLVTRRPKSGLALELLSTAYMARQDFKNARKTYEKLQELVPEDVKSTLGLARIDLLEDKVDEARIRYRSVVDRQGISTDAFVQAANALGELAVGSGKLDIARHHYEAILKIKESEPRALLALARMAVREDDEAKAVSLLEQSRSVNSKALAPRILLSSLYLQQRKIVQALSLALEAHAQGPKNLDVLIALIRAQMAAGQRDDALATGAALVRQHSQSAEAHFQQAMAYSMTRNRAAFRSALKRAVSLDPKYVPAQLALGKLALASGRKEEALKIARKVSKDAPERPLGYSLEGDVLLFQELPEEAAVAYRKAHKIEASNQSVRKYSQALFASGETTRAKALLVKWIEKQPDAFEVRLALAMQYFNDKQPDAARKELEHVVQLRPNHAYALNNLAWLYHQQGDSRALGVAKRAYEAAPTELEVMDTYGWFLLETGGIEQGLQILRAAAARAKNRPDILYHFAKGLARSGDIAGARKQLTLLLDSEASQRFSAREKAAQMLKQLQ